MSLKNLKSGVADVVEVVSADATVYYPDQGVKHVFITKGTAADITLSAPVSGQHDGSRIKFIATTAAAHTVTCGTIGFNAANTTGDVGTFGGAIGDGFETVAYGGENYTTYNTNVTLA
jgi:hypothetical protein